MIFDPPIKLHNGDVEVLEIDTEEYFIEFIVHLHLTKSQKYIDTLIMSSFKYLETEDYIPSGRGWHSRLAIILHNQTNQHGN